MSSLRDSARPDVNGAPRRTDKVNTLIIWYPYESENLGRNIIHINLDEKEIGGGNASVNDYGLYLDSFLFQSESGQYMVEWQDDIKGPGFNPELKIDTNTIEFKTPYSQKKGLKTQTLVKIILGEDA